MDNKNIKKPSMVPIINQCIKKFGWSKTHAIEIYKEYIRFMSLRNQNSELSPSDKVDLLWHQHILNTKHYYDYCLYRFGELVNHDPTDANDKVKRSKRIDDTLREYNRSFKDVPNEKVWGKSKVKGVLKFGFIKMNDMKIYNGFYYKENSGKPYDGEDFFFDRDTETYKIVKLVRKLGYGDEFVVEFRDNKKNILEGENLISFPEEFIIHVELEMNRRCGC